MRFLLYLPILCGFARAQEPLRPKILGIAQVSFLVSDLGPAGRFYREILGYRAGLPIVINDRQSVALKVGEAGLDGRLNSITFYTNDVIAMGKYLSAHGIQVSEAVAGRIAIRDPDGHAIEFAAYLPAAQQFEQRGISDHLMHAGITVGSLDRSQKFYADILGFREFWRGSAVGSGTLSWVNMRVPEGDEYIEFMLYRQLPDPAARGGQNHICLIVAHVDAEVERLRAIAAHTSYKRPIKAQTGVNRKRQVNLFDPDGTRVEIMEPGTIDGEPAVSSEAPPPA